MNDNEHVRIAVTLSEVMNYAQYQNGIRTIKSIIISSDSTESIRDMVLKVSCDDGIIRSDEIGVNELSPESDLEIKDFDISVNASELAEITERITVDLLFELKTQDTVIASLSKKITVLAYDEWQGLSYSPELITAFITPNEAHISKILSRASVYLNNWTSDPSFNAYQTQNPNRVIYQAAAVYSAICEQNIVYSEPQASFEQVGQRVRLCDKVLEQKLGTCLDLSLLFVSCLEAVGINTLLLFKSGHVFPGYWLEEMTFADSVSDDPSLITKKMADGISELTVLESTTMISGKTVTFSDSQMIGKNEINDDKPVSIIVDVKRARLSGVRPLPVRVRTENGWMIEEEKQETEGIHQSAPDGIVNHVDIDATSTDQRSGKLQIWEKKLLDLSLKNPLINMRYTNKVIPLISTSLNDLEDSMSSGNEFTIASRPAEWQIAPEDMHSFEKVCDIGPYKEIIKSEYSNKRLRSLCSESELNSSVKDLYRSAKKTLEENGANSLYLAFGFLKWYETKKSEKERYAPLILMPVELVRCGANKGYKIRIRDEESVMNVTLLEMLKQTFDIPVVGLDPLPTDEHGVDVTRIFSIIRTAVMDQPRWDIVEAAFLGVFSFSQFVMWNDIKNRSDELAKNKVVKSLIAGHIEWNVEDFSNKDIDEKDVLLPISVDASQLYAIEAAENGQSFVLHGPPGTGKSQTITAMIANALGNGKTVLFVAEKMAALSVVQKRLDDLGLSPFCLELHSNKSKKKDVLEQLKQASEVTHYTENDYFVHEADKAKQLRLELDGYDSALHKEQAFGMSVYQIISEYEEIPGSGDRIVFSSAFAKAQSRDSLGTNLSTISKMIAQARVIGDVHNNRLSFVIDTEYSQSKKNHLEEMLDNYSKSILELKDAENCFTEQTKVPVAETWNDIKHSVDVAEQIANWTGLPDKWSQSDNIPGAMQTLSEWSSTEGESLRLFGELSQHYGQDFFSLNAEQLGKQWDDVNQKKHISHFFARNSLKKSLKSYLLLKFDDEMFSKDITDFIRYQELTAHAKKLKQDCLEFINALPDDKKTAYSQINEMAAKVSDISSKLCELTGITDFCKRNIGAVEKHESASRLIKAWSNVLTEKKALYGLLTMDESSVNVPWISAELNRCNTLLSEKDNLRDYIIWNGICAEAVKEGLEPVVDALNSGMDLEEVEDAYKKGCLKQLIILSIDEDNALSAFSGSVFNEQIRQLKDISQKMQAYAQQEIFCRLASKIPDFTHEVSQSSELGILQRAIKSNGRALSIRSLFEQIPDVLPRLCPCMLMSPLSAAQYLDPKREPFDLVVFDEASQLTTCKAIGAIARGKNAVIVGDPNQMPPTSFFMGNKDDDDDVNEDLDSILDDCLAIGMPDSHLLWHYRSRHESLIAFSNNEFYDNKLYTFPSFNDRKTKVSFVHVDGVFDRGKTRKNKAEAEAIVNEIIRRSKDPLHMEESIGVVTFNISQQNCIDDLVEEKRGADQCFDDWYTSAKEQMFIKNLENVQGDERDVILFSIGYGPDSSGKVNMSFGPINREGGWRRLNVAVSRARMEMIVFSSMYPEQIDESRSSARGVSEIKAFLKYAQNNSLPVMANNGTCAYVDHDGNGIADRVCELLSEDGYKTRQNIGHSKFKVDIGVIDPDNKDDYLVGILLDGGSYKNAKNAYDRDIAQLNVLRGLGWNVIRIWTMDWWDNPKREYANIRGYIEECHNHEGKRNQKPANISAQITINQAEVLHVEEQKDHTEMYVAAVLEQKYIEANEFVERYAYSGELFGKITNVMNVEAPVSGGTITKRVTDSYGITRAGRRIQAVVDGTLNNMVRNNKVRVTVQNGNTIYWRPEQNPGEYSVIRRSGEGTGKRDIKDVPIQEIMNAIVVVVKSSVSIPEDALIRETGRILGYSRNGNKVNDYVLTGIKEAITEQKVKKNESGNIMVNENSVGF